MSGALVRRGTLYIRTKFNVLGINFIVGRLRCMIYVMKSMAHVVILDYLGYSLVNYASFVYFLSFLLIPMI